MHTIIIYQIFVLSPALGFLDYVPVTKEIAFNNYTERVHPLYIPIINDDCFEYDEYFSVKVTTDMECVYLVNDTAHITILEDDSEYTLFSYVWNQNLMFCCIIMVFSVPKVSLASEFFYTNENDLYVLICIELKSDLKRDVDFYLYLIEGSATGKPL